APGASLGAPPAGKAHLVEEDLAELLRRADVEVLAGKLPDLVLEPGDGLGEGERETGKHRLLDLDAGALHLGEHWSERPLEGLGDGSNGLGRTPRLSGQPKPESER